MGSMNYARQGDTATVLPDGRVLVVGGATDSGNSTVSTELYDPKTGTWSLTGNTHVPHINHVAVLLANGDVLVAGGENAAGNSALASAELYNPRTGTWSQTGRMKYPRENFTATLLSSGKVLVAGGDDGNQFAAQALSSAELYNPWTGTWSQTGKMNEARDLFAAALIPNHSSEVLAVGGISCNPTAGSCIISSAEVYNPAKGTWTLTAPMSQARYAFTASEMGTGSGKVLVAGGLTPEHVDTTSTEIYDASRGTWITARNMGIARDAQTASCLSNGQILIAGGVNSNSGVLSSTEVFIS
jgi:N-acetylneuraminic acid mutarotase